MLAFTTPDRDPGIVDVENLDLIAEDGLALGATLFQPKQPHGVLIIHAATAVPQSYYRRFAYFAAAATGARVLTYDYRGIGRSRPAALRGFQASMDDWALLDARAAHAFVRARFGGEPLALIGHSFGGQLVGLLDEAREAAGMIMVGAQFGYYGHWSGLAQLRMQLIWRALIPAFNAVFGYVPGRAGLGEDLPRGVAEQWGRWCLHPDYLISEHTDAAERYARFDRPLLFYSFSDDAMAPHGGVANLLSRLPHARLDHARVSPEAHGGDPIGHFGFFRSRFAPTLWQEAADFLRAVLAGDAPPARKSAADSGSLHAGVMADLEYGRAS
jgi:predicted alpha/beta hydrolase